MAMKIKEFMFRQAILKQCESTAAFTLSISSEIRHLLPPASKRYRG